MPRGYPGSTPGVDPRSQGVIPRRFKRKKIFVADAGWTDGQTDVLVEIVIYIYIIIPQLVHFFSPSYPSKGVCAIIEFHFKIGHETR